MPQIRKRPSQEDLRGGHSHSSHSASRGEDRSGQKPKRKGHSSSGGKDRSGHDRSGHDRSGHKSTGKSHSSGRRDDKGKGKAVDQGGYYDPSPAGPSAGKSGTAAFYGGLAQDITRMLPMPPIDPEYFDPEYYDATAATAASAYFHPAPTAVGNPQQATTSHYEPPNAAAAAAAAAAAEAEAEADAEGETEAIRHWLGQQQAPRISTGSRPPCSYYNDTYFPYDDRSERKSMESNTRPTQVDDMLEQRGFYRDYDKARQRPKKD